MKGNFMVFDTETTGLPTVWNSSYQDVHNWPRITQLAWELCDYEGNTIRKECYLIKPDGWKIPKESFFLDNNMSTERCEAEGAPFDIVAENFLFDIARAEVLIAHNMSFDKMVMNCELYRYREVLGLLEEPPLHIKKYCTKLESEPICKIKTSMDHKKYKWPSLAEAYEFFFKKGFEGAHDAGFDVQACKEVYLAIRAFKDKDALNKLM